MPENTTPLMVISFSPICIRTKTIKYYSEISNIKYEIKFWRKEDNFHQIMEYQIVNHVLWKHPTPKLVGKFTNFSSFSSIKHCAVLQPFLFKLILLRIFFLFFCMNIISYVYIYIKIFVNMMVIKTLSKNFWRMPTDILLQGNLQFFFAWL